MYEFETATLLGLLESGPLVGARNYVRTQPGYSEWLADNEPDLFNLLAKNAQRSF